MSLNRQCFLYSVCTDAFYEPEEQEIHKRLLKLYGLRKLLKDSKLMAKNEIANDYDVDQLADRLKKQIYDDASYRNVNFINYLK